MDFFLFLSSVVTTLLCMWGVCFFFPKWGLLDRPQAYGLTRAPLPYSAGLAIVFVFLFHLLVFFPHSKHFIGFILGGLLVAVVSALDDFFRIKALHRLIIHTLAASIIVLSGIGIEHITNPFGGVIDLTLWKIPLDIAGTTYHLIPLADLFTVLWIVFVMNAINLLDGIPGLVSGVGSIGSYTLMILSLFLIGSPLTTVLEKQHAQEIAHLALCLGTILMIFNRFDFFPNKVVIGDSGAMFIGYTLAVLSIFSGGKVATTLIVLGLPLIDMLWVVTRRLSKGQSPFQGDHNHFHHKLLRLGFSERQTLMLMYGISILLGACSLLLLFTLQSLGKFIIIACILLLMFVTSWLLIQKETSEVKQT